MRDYDFTFDRWSLEPFSEMKGLQDYAPQELSKIQVSEWISRHGGERKLVVRGMRGIPITITREKLAGFTPHLVALEETVKDPDEVYLFKGVNAYYYTYFRFFSNAAIMVDVAFGLDEPYRVDRLLVLDPSKVDVKRKGSLYYAKKIRPQV